jgi:hypothetical protein
MLIFLIILFLVIVKQAFGEEDGIDDSSPTSVNNVEPNENFLTMLNRLHPGNRIGYRIHEHLPFVYGTVPEDTKTAGIDMDQIDQLESEYSSQSGVFIHSRKVTEEGWVPQDWIYYIVPVEDGFHILWVVSTGDAGLNEFYAVQQCFRMSGKTNAEWRRKIAETPAFSEYDLWSKQEEQNKPKTSLTYIRRNDAWEEMPPVPRHVAYRTPLGIIMDTNRTNGNPDSLKEIKPYGPSTFEPPIDCGLATRISTDGEWVCGIYWQRTTHITNHHPADCLHPIVNLGPIPPNSKRALLGRIYWMEASRDQLFSRWMADFPHEDY